MKVGRRAVLAGMAAFAVDAEPRREVEVEGVAVLDFPPPIPLDPIPTASFATGDVFSLADVLRATEKLREANVAPGPGGYYFLRASPIQAAILLLDLDPRLSYADRCLALERGRMRERRGLAWESPYEWTCRRLALEPWRLELAPRAPSEPVPYRIPSPFPDPPA